MESPVDNQAFHYIEIVECVKSRMETYGLEDAMRHFASMDLVMSCLSWWHLVKREVDAMFAERRKEERQLEMERIKAGVPINIYQIQPLAQAGVDVSGSGNQIAKEIKNDISTTIDELWKKGETWKIATNHAGLSST